MSVRETLRARRWWRWQTAAAASGLTLSLTAGISVGTNYLDERSDVANDEAARLRSQRADYEAECRFTLNLDVLVIEGEQLDGMSDLLSALAAEDRDQALTVVGHLVDLKRQKDAAEERRAGAVETCNRQAHDLYPTPGG